MNMRDHVRKAARTLGFTVHSDKSGIMLSRTAGAGMDVQCCDNWGEAMAFLMQRPQIFEINGCGYWCKVIREHGAGVVDVAVLSTGACYRIAGLARRVGP